MKTKRNTYLVKAIGHQSNSTSFHNRLPMPGRSGERARPPKRLFDYPITLPWHRTTQGQGPDSIFMLNNIKFTASW